MKHDQWCKTNWNDDAECTCSAVTEIEPVKPAVKTGRSVTVHFCNGHEGGTTYAADGRCTRCFLWPRPKTDG